MVKSPTWADCQGSSARTFVKPALRAFSTTGPATRKGTSLSGVAAEGVEVAVVVVLVADHDGVQVRQLLRLEGDRLARVVQGPLGEPGVGEHGQAADLDQVAAVGDPGDGERLGHD